MRRPVKSEQERTAELLGCTCSQETVADERHARDARKEIYVGWTVEEHRRWLKTQRGLWDICD